MTIPSFTHPFRYNYNAQDQLLNLQNPPGKITTWAYKDGLLIGQNLPCHASSSYRYDGKEQLIDLINLSKSLPTRYDVTAFNGAEDITNVTTRYYGNPTESISTNYTYDASGQLLLEQVTPLYGTTPLFTHNFSYDAAINPIHFGDLNSSPIQYDANNELLGPYYDYDGMGNPTTYNGNSLTFDAASRLLEFAPSGNTPTLTADYNAAGLRVWCEVDGVRRYFLYDGILPVCELDTDGNVPPQSIPGVRQDRLHEKMPRN